MAGDWIKMRGNLWDDPRVAALVDMTDTSEAAVVGALYWLWATADQHTEDGFMPGLTLRQIDRKTGVQGLGKALCEIGWLAETPDGVCLQNFTEHNGASAKRRATEAQRKANTRKVSASVADKAGTDIGQPEDEIRQVAELEKEKRREELIQEEANASLSTAALPDCPHTEIIQLFGERLPELPQPRAELWDGQRAKALTARWRWCLTAKRADGRRYATDRDEALQWFGRFFGYVRRCPLLMGENDRNWTADLGWLVKADNFAKVQQGNYDNKQLEVT